MPGEHVLVDKTAQVFRHWQRGDVVLFRAPDTGTLSIKRIVGLAGETVAIRDGHLFVDDDRVPEPYVEPGAIDSVYYGPRRVAEGQVLVFGDNRRNSRDSRDYGGVPISLVEGRITMILWPPGHAGGSAVSERTRYVRWVAGVVGMSIAGVLAGPAGPAAAHAELVGSSPAPGTTLRVPVEQVSLDFDEPPGARVLQVAVIGPDGRNLVTGDTTAGRYPGHRPGPQTDPCRRLRHRLPRRGW